MNTVALNTCPAVHQGYLNRINELKTGYTDTLALVVRNYSAYKTGDDTTTYGNDVAQLAATEAELHMLIGTINTNIVGVQKLADDAAVQMDNVSTAQDNLASGDPDKLDSTSRRTRLDFADQYRLAYYVVWVKVVLIGVIVYFLYSQQNLLLSAAVFVAITLVWYVWVSLLAMYRGRNPPCAPPKPTWRATRACTENVVGTATRSPTRPAARAPRSRPTRSRASTAPTAVALTG